jgi:hypothetical protein
MRIVENFPPPPPKPPRTFTLDVTEEELHELRYAVAFCVTSVNSYRSHDTMNLLKSQFLLAAR